MIYILLSLIFFIAAVAGFVVSFIIVATKKNRNQNFFLSLCLFGLAVESLYNFYLSASILKDFSNAFIIFRPFIFLVAPSAFLYVRTVLFPGKKIIKKDWLHFLPFILCFSYLFFSLLENYINYFGRSFNVNGFLSIDYIPVKINTTFSLLTVAIWLIYTVLQTILVLTFDLQRDRKKQYLNVKVINWIRIFNLMMMALFTTLFVHLFLSNSTVNIVFLYKGIVSFILIFIAGWLYFQPQIIFYPQESFAIFEGNNRVVSKTHEIKDVLPVTGLLTEEKKQAYLVILEQVFLNKKLFLKRNLVIRDLSEETGIPIHHLSSLINSEFNFHFQDYVNLKRIEYFQEKVNDIDWKHLSLEGMAWGSGFKSRTTCFRAFVKHTGKSPSAYFKFTRITSERRNEYLVK